jgi:uncharacterized protein (DUF1778 family)
MTNKSERLFIRVNEKEKALLEAAADARGLSLSSYVRMVALEQAKKDQKNASKTAS